MIKVEEQAASYLQEVLKENEAKYLRLLFQGFGWGGPNLGIALEESILESDHVEQVDGLTFLINERDMPYFKEGATIRFVQSFFGPRIHIQLANAPFSQC